MRVLVRPRSIVIYKEGHRWTLSDPTKDPIEIDNSIQPTKFYSGEFWRAETWPNSPFYPVEKPFLPTKGERLRIRRIPRWMNRVLNTVTGRLLYVATSHEGGHTKAIHVHLL